MTSLPRLGENAHQLAGDVGLLVLRLSAWFGAYMRLAGGIVVLFGALTRLIAAGFAVVMAGALVFVHPGEPLVLAPDGSGSGFAFIMFAASLALLGTGAGRFSADRLLAARRTRATAVGATSGAQARRAGRLRRAGGGRVHRQW